jgi:hypothetical protein
MAACRGEGEWEVQRFAVARASGLCGSAGANGPIRPGYYRRISSYQGGRRASRTPDAERQEGFAAPGPRLHFQLGRRAVVHEAPDPFWDEFIEAKGAAQLGKRWAGMRRAVSGPITAAAFALRPNA